MSKKATSDMSEKATQSGRGLRWLSPGDAAEVAGISKQLIADYIKTGRVRYRGAGRKKRVELGDVLKEMRLRLQRDLRNPNHRAADKVEVLQARAGGPTDREPGEPAKKLDHKNLTGQDLRDEKIRREIDILNAKLSEIEGTVITVEAVGEILNRLLSTFRGALDVWVSSARSLGGPEVSREAARLKDRVLESVKTELKNMEVL